MLLLCYIALIILLNLVPIGGSLNTTTIGPLRLDYLLHTILFLPWMALVCWRVRRTPAGWRLQRKPLGPGRCLLWLALGIALAFGVEGLQHFVAQRSFNLMDGGCNALGVVLGSPGAFVMVDKNSNIEYRNPKQFSNIK